MKDIMSFMKVMSIDELFLIILLMNIVKDMLKDCFGYQKAPIILLFVMWL
jgi:hypothetical protein